MVSDQTKATIDALSYEELLQEVLNEERSRFQRENFGYLMTRFVMVKKSEEDKIKEKELHLAQEANILAKAANDTSARAYRISSLSVVVAVIALLVAILPQCSTIH